MAPSGTAPSTGSTMLPTIPAMDGTRRSSSLPSEMRLLALKSTTPINCEGPLSRRER
uniref:Uncharacterized protein n=1 Tax=Hyaloperonospora arabidopsidis (strain Emoy2) TaxID=559515 RepID=M4BED0_HYAAE